MLLRLMVALTVLLVGVGSMASVFTVTDTASSGVGTLRWAISQANTNPGGDKIVFDASLSGQTIKPTCNLPHVVDNETVIDGDLDDDGAPDVEVSGELLTTPGCQVALIVINGADSCTIRGLALNRHPKYGLRIIDGEYNVVRSCHIGADLAGTTARPNGQGEIWLDGCDYTVIGGPTKKARNVIGVAVDEVGGAMGTGMRINDISHSTIRGNYIGLTRDGMASLGSLGTCAIGMGGTTPSDCAHNLILGNVLGGMEYGLGLGMAAYNKIAGNYFGLAADGDTVVPLPICALYFGDGAHHNVIGGTGAADRNVFAGECSEGIVFWPGSASNRVFGNYFGLNAAGTAQRELRGGIYVTQTAGGQTIGGTRPGQGNYFTCSSAVSTPPLGIDVTTPSGVVIKGNTFGRRPDGVAASKLGEAIFIRDASPTIADNTIARSQDGVYIDGAASNPIIARNVFRQCDRGVTLWSNASCRLGNVGNANKNDDGGNRFRLSNICHIFNHTPNNIKAENNDFVLKTQDEIEEKIYDWHDDHTLGKVDILPLMGATTACGAAPALTAASACSTAGGAEIAFTLSAPASVSVEVLNLAGRTVATVAENVRVEAGLQRLVWSGRTTTGASAPAGAYLVRIAARSANGACTNAVAPLNVQR
jgi:hypothetical protein